jgi:hypothetical protein
MFKRYRTFASDVKTELKKHGLRALFRKYGWKLVAVAFTTYLIRDIALYLVLPWLVARSLVTD